jgi:hypothetical protein
MSRPFYEILMWVSGGGIGEISEGQGDGSGDI